MKTWRIWLILALGLIAGASVYMLLSTLERPQPYGGTELTGIAPNFQLIDQNGLSVSLSDFYGQIVVLTFMDSECKDTCPLTAADLRQAYRQLDQNEARQVVFLGVNVNVEANTAKAVLQATHEWLLEEIPGWHFLTGRREDLEPVWKDYAIAVVPGPDGNEITHTPGVFIIDSLGQQRWYVSTPYSAEGNAEWTLPLSDLLLKHIYEILNENISGYLGEFHVI